MSERQRYNPWRTAALALALVLAVQGVLPRAAHAEPPEGDAGAVVPDAVTPSAPARFKRVTRLDTGVTRYELGKYGDYLYGLPHWYDWVVRPLPDAWHYTRKTFRRKNTARILGMVAVTAGLVAVDQSLIYEVQRWGDQLGIEPNKDNTKTVVDLARYQVRVPSDLGSAIYFLGDGWTHLSVGATVLVSGLITHDNRAIQTGSQVFEAVLSSGAITQILKHLTGRESPGDATVDGGRWQLLPDQRDYFKHVSAYDAFPSGHLATAMATVTVLALNYPEKRYIWPVGGVLMTALSLQMMNNGVHWASDYPLAIAIGYSIGKLVVNHGRTPTPQGGDEGPSVAPTLIPDGQGGFVPGLEVDF